MICRFSRCIFLVDVIRSASTYVILISLI
jgi:hypothetical protein